jgi:D-alanine-D-alanine ligase-like ATP-grasp enzyme
MFGIDIVIEKGTTNHVVIDINYFPGMQKKYCIFTTVSDKMRLSLE